MGWSISTLIKRCLLPIDCNKECVECQLYVCMQLPCARGGNTRLNLLCLVKLKKLPCRTHAHGVDWQAPLFAKEHAPYGCFTTSVVFYGSKRLFADKWAISQFPNLTDLGLRKHITRQLNDIFTFLPALQNPSVN